MQKFEHEESTTQITKVKTEVGKRKQKKPKVRFEYEIIRLNEPSPEAIKAFNK